jgi:hypothetical protein
VILRIYTGPDGESHFELAPAFVRNETGEITTTRGGGVSFGRAHPDP